MTRFASVLDGHGLSEQPVRGTDSALSLPPISSAVIIGIGGSGIQTISRTRSAVRGARPDQAAADSIRFLGIDAVDISAQVPPLPAGVGLPTSEIFNLTESPFDASTYISGRLPTDKFLQQWWEPSYRPPPGPLTDGLKRERMLGRLAFHRESHRLRDRISVEMARAIALKEEQNTETGDRPPVPKIPVYIVCSSCGGTGSSGLLEVVFAVWSAARRDGYTPEIRVFLYLPGVFRLATLATPNGAIAVEAQASNAFGFFRELDHFMQFSSELGLRFGESEAAGGPRIPPGALIHQVYLMEDHLRGLGTFEDLRDVYEIVAEAIFHFLLSNLGRPMVGANSANTDQALSEYDAFDKPRRYCSLGIARVVFPGDTYRQHAVMRYIDWFIRRAFLMPPARVESVARESEITAGLEDFVYGLDARAQDLEAEDEIADLQIVSNQALASLTATPTAEEARKLIGRIDQISPAAERMMEELAELRNRTLLAELNDRVRREVFSAGYSIPFAAEVLKLTSKRIANLRKDATTEASGGAVAVGVAKDRMSALLQELEAVAARRPHEKVRALLVRAVGGKAKSQADVAGELGQAIQLWASAILSNKVAEARSAFDIAADELITGLRKELSEATRRLEKISDRAKREWERDDLKGKDAGPRVTTALIPADVMPEVEDSSLARRLFEEFDREHNARLRGDLLVQFLREWELETGLRGLFSLGSRSEQEAEVAMTTLLDALERDARLYGLMTVEDGEKRSRLPRDLHEAAAGDEAALTAATASLARTSRSVAWSWDEGRFMVPGNDADSRNVSATPVVTTVVAAHSSATKLIRQHVGGDIELTPSVDPERIVALSTEWAVPVHALHAVHSWERAYERTLRRCAQDHRTCPPHIDTRFVSTLKSLIPEYVSQETAALYVGQGLVFARLLARADGRGLYKPGKTVAVRGPISSGPASERFRWSGTIVTDIDGFLRVQDGDLDLGRDWGELLERVGEDMQLRKSIDTVIAAALDRIGVDRIRGEIDLFVTNDLGSEAANPGIGKRNGEAVLAVLDALSVWQVELNRRGWASGHGGSGVDPAGDA